jgi:hypothetical protein
MSIPRPNAVGSLPFTGVRVQGASSQGRKVSSALRSPAYGGPSHGESSMLAMGYQTAGVKELLGRLEFGLGYGRRGVDDLVVRLNQEHTR